MFVWNVLCDDVWFVFVVVFVCFVQCLCVVSVEECVMLYGVLFFFVCLLCVCVCVSFMRSWLLFVIYCVVMYGLVVCCVCLCLIVLKVCVVCG